TTLLDAVPVAVTAVAWAVAGLGMGMSYSGLSLMVLAEAPAGEEAAASSSLQLSDVWGMALGTGLGGSAVALPVLLSGAARVGIGAAFGLAVAAGVTACWAARRLPGTEGAGLSRR
ncbi:MAG TPA: hypothetical protein VFO65_08300, partial [Acidimicrobiales bacterium]|nr:hypothetical protein [Acidimicrobiales bacterium]